jgi:hypothetical protein
MNGQQLMYTKKIEKQRRRVHEVETKVAQIRSALQQRKLFLHKNFNESGAEGVTSKVRGGASGARGPDLGGLIGVARSR